jgi:hypothetical protein
MAAAATTIAIIIAASSSTSAFAPPPPPSSSLLLAGGRNGIGRHRGHRGHRDATTTVPNRAAMVPEWLAFDAAATTAAASTAASTAMTTTMAEHRQPASLLLEAFSSPAATASALSSSVPPSLASSPDLLLSFSDQGQNLAGTFFQLSLLPYLVFLYFLGFRGNRTPDLGKFGFAYLLLFVGGTIPSGIITKGAYGLNLANVDWIHGGAEALLTITNVLIVSIRKNNVRSGCSFLLVEVAERGGGSGGLKDVSLPTATLIIEESLFPFGEAVCGSCVVRVSSSGGGGGSGRVVVPKIQKAFI